MVDNDLKEGGGGVLKLPEERPKAFTVYVQWLCTTRIVASEQLTSFDTMFELYAMGARLQDPDFQDAIMDAIISDICSIDDPIPDEKCVEIVYKNTEAGDPARCLLVDLWARYSEETWFDNWEVGMFTEGMGEFFFDLARAQINQDRGFVFQRGETCTYHHHGEKPCYQEKRPETTRKRDRH